MIRRTTAARSSTTAIAAATTIRRLSARRPSLSQLCRGFASSSPAADVDDDNDDNDVERESMPFDVLIVGGGPAGLCASIRLKQLCQTHNHDLSVCVIDKGSEIGSHILSGNVLDPIAMRELFPEKADQQSDNHWTKELLEMTNSYATPVDKDEFKIFTNDSKSYTIPNVLLPSQLDNHNNYIVSLSQVCRYLGQQAEELGVEIYPGFAASNIIVDDNNDNVVRGIVTRDVGIGKDGKTKKPTFEPGVELRAKQTLLAEGARGSCSEWLMDKFQMRGSGTHPQTYGLGIKEVWQVPEENFQKGLVQHTLGFPLQDSLTSKVFGGSFLYHQEPDLILLGLVVGLDYENPYLNPYLEFQKYKTHPDIAGQLQNGTCISYGARVLNEGGYHSIPEKLTVPGASLIGCSAGFLNAVKIKGTHTAMKSGMLAAEAIFEQLSKEESSVADTMELDDSYQPQELTSYPEKLKDSWVYKELYQVRNCHTAFAKWGTLGGLAYTGLAAHITKGKEPWTLSHHTKDCDTTKPAEQFQPIEYPKPDGKLTFDLLTNLQRSGTYHAEDQPIHLRVKPDLAHVPVDTSFPTFAGPEQRFCPAGVYEYVDNSDDSSNDTKSGCKKQLVINAQNCIHCKCCSIKMPSEYIDWTVPEGGGGPQYQVM